MLLYHCYYTMILTMLLYHSGTIPQYYNAALYHDMPPWYYTTTLNHSIIPQYYITVLYHNIIPRQYYTTILYHSSIIPRYYTTTYITAICHSTHLQIRHLSMRTTLACQSRNVPSNNAFVLCYKCLFQSYS